MGISILQMPGFIESLRVQAKYFFFVFQIFNVYDTKIVFFIVQTWTPKPVVFVLVQAKAPEPETPEPGDA